MLTNFGISQRDALMVSLGSNDVEQRQLETRLASVADGGHTAGNLSEMFHPFIMKKGKGSDEGDLDQLQESKRKKLETIARLIDLTNGDAKSVHIANIEKTVLRFARREGDVGSPEVQGTCRFDVPDSS